jgi:CheY-like chemotaxis protein
MLQKAEREGSPFTLVLLDVVALETDAERVAALRALRGDGVRASLGVVACHSFGNPGAAQALVAAGFDGCVSKPLRRRELRELVQKLLASVARRGAAAPAASLNLAGRFPRLAGRILLVEDNITNQQVAQAMLQMLGVSAGLVTNGREALQALSENTYDLVLMDCQMPEMDGYEATRRIRAAGAAVRNTLVPIIAMTANAMPEDRLACLAAGMNDYLPKPVNASALATVLQKWLPAGSAEPPDHPARPPVSAAATPVNRAGLPARLLGLEERANLVRDCPADQGERTPETGPS